MKLEKAPINPTESSTAERLKAAREERKELLKTVGKSIASLAAEVTPFASLVPFIHKIKTGKTVTGTKLESRDRIVYSIIVGINFIYYYYLLSSLLRKGVGVPEAVASATWATSTGIYALQKSSETFRFGKELKESDVPEFINNARELAIDYDMQSLIEPLNNCQKIMERYKYKNVVDLIMRMNEEKLNATS